MSLPPARPLLPGSAGAVNAMPDPIDSAEPLRVRVEQVAGVLAFDCTQHKPRFGYSDLARNSPYRDRKTFIGSTFAALMAGRTPAPRLTAETKATPLANIHGSMG